MAEDSDGQQITVAELLKRMGAEQPAAPSGRRHRRADEGGLSVSELTGEIPRITDDTVLSGRAARRRAREAEEAADQGAQSPPEGETATKADGPKVVPSDAGAGSAPRRATTTTPSTPSPSTLQPGATQAAAVQAPGQQAPTRQQAAAPGDESAHPGKKGRRGLFGRKRTEQEPTGVQAPAAQTVPAEQAGETKPAEQAEQAGETKPAEQAEQAGETKPAGQAEPAGATPPQAWGVPTGSGSTAHRGPESPVDAASDKAGAAGKAADEAAPASTSDAGSGSGRLGGAVAAAAGGAGVAGMAAAATSSGRDFAPTATGQAADRHTDSARGDSEHAAPAYGDSAHTDLPHGDSAHAGQERSGASQWLILVAQVLASAVAGAALFIGFQLLWGDLPWVAFALAIIVIVGLVAMVRVLRRSNDTVSIALAVIVGLGVTCGPLLLRLVT